MRGEGERPAALVLLVGGQHPVGVEVGQDPLPELAELLRWQLRTGCHQLLLGLSHLFHRHGRRQPFQHPTDLAGLLAGQRTGRNRLGHHGQHWRQHLAGDRHPRTQIPRRRHPPLRGLG